jgi:hypothetical protein
MVYLGRDKGWYEAQSDVAAENSRTGMVVANLVFNVIPRLAKDPLLALQQQNCVDSDYTVIG